MGPQVKSGFAEGMKQAIDFMKNAFTTIKVSGRSCGTTY
jgi:hypothetical protein